MTTFSDRRRMMVDTQVRPSDVTKFPIIAAMLAVPRENFVPSQRREAAYVGENLPLGPADRVLLEPRTFAKMLDAIDVRPDELVLDVGAGMGYSAAVIGRMAEAVVALEEDEALAHEAEAALAAAGADNVAVVQGRLSAGAAKHGPYDVITVEGAVEAIAPALVEQLKEGGRIACIFSTGSLGVMKIGLKSGGEITWRPAFNAAAPVLPGFAAAPAFVL
jgi:protein-L-isoaspartate(D-aspartate) O-methyltransferase